MVKKFDFKGLAGKELTAEEVIAWKKQQDRYMRNMVKNAMLENKMEDGISWEECSARFDSVTLNFGSHTLDAWQYFKKIYDEIPQEHRLKMQLHNIYPYYHFNLVEFFSYLKLSLNEENELQCNARVEHHRELFKDRINIDGFMTVYRGINNNSLDGDLALSYTISREKAEWFADRFSFEGGFDRVDVISKDINVDDILLYTNDRDEQEVILRPPIIDLMASDSIARIKRSAKSTKYLKGG